MSKVFAITAEEPGRWKRLAAKRQDKVSGKSLRALSPLRILAAGKNAHIAEQGGSEDRRGVFP